MESKERRPKMTCSKCNKIVNPDWLCCPFHAELAMLKEKCPECGEMEWIGRPVCETKLREVYEKQQKYVEKNIPPRPNTEKGEKTMALVVLGHTILLFCLYLCASFFPQHLNLWRGFVVLVAISFFLSFLYFPVTALVCSKKYSKQYDEWWKEKESLYEKFLDVHPEYAEILKKAKSVEAKSTDGEEEKK
jgi:hypothetical protein